MKAKHFITGAVLAASTVASSAALAESPFTGNIGLTSNYIWRGQTQTNDQAAIQGGLDYAWEQGFYVGAWVSNVSWTTPAGYELDLYAGYGFDWKNTSWDVGYIAYTYPLSSPDGEDFSEIYVNFGWEWLGAGIAYTVNTDAGGDDSDLYYYASGEWEVAGLTLGGLIGSYDFDGGSTEDYDHFQLYLSKSDFTFAIDKNNSDEAAWGTSADELRATVSYTKNFDL